MVVVRLAECGEEVFDDGEWKRKRSIGDVVVKLRLGGRDTAALEELAHIAVLVLCGKYGDRISQRR